MWSAPPPWWRGRSPRNTLPIPHDLESLVITYQGHPLCGQRLPVVRLLRTLGRPAVVVRLENGQTIQIPLDWTDQRPPRPVLMGKGRIARLHPGGLRELRARVTELLCTQAISAAKLDSASGERTFPIQHEHADAGEPLFCAAGSDPEAVPGRRGQPCASGAVSAKRRGGR